MHMKELTLEARIENLASVLSFIDAELEAAGCPMREQMQIDVAAEEIFANIASYAYAPGTGSATVGIETSADPFSATIVFSDSGVPYDPLSREDPDVTLPAEERDVGGLGVYMTKKLMDCVSYEYSDGKNILTLRKTVRRLPPDK